MERRTQNHIMGPDKGFLRKSNFNVFILYNFKTPRCYFYRKLAEPLYIHINILLIN